MDRFIEPLAITARGLFFYLKSSMDRFIAHILIHIPLRFRNLKSSMDRFIEIIEQKFYNVNYI